MQFRQRIYRKYRVLFFVVFYLLNQIKLWKVNGVLDFQSCFRGGNSFCNHFGFVWTELITSKSICKIYEGFFKVFCSQKGFYHFSPNKFFCKVKHTKSSRKRKCENTVIIILFFYLFIYSVIAKETMIR